MAGDLGFAIILHSYRSFYVTWYLIDTAADSILLVAVLIELAWSILRPVQASLSRRALLLIAALLASVGVAIWPFSSLPGISGAVGEKHVIVQMQQAVSILEVVFFLAVIAGSQMLSMSWRDRELQVATGLGFSSAVNLAAAMLRTHQTSLVQYRHLDQLLIGAWICTLLYWAASFARQEAERREFTPEMQRLLLSIAGVARSTRIGLEGPQTIKSRK